MRPVLNQSGMSLIELTVIIIVVGILTSVAMQSMTAQMEDVRRAKTEREMAILADAIAGNPELSQNGLRSDFGYVGDVGSFPPNLNALASNPGGYATWNGPYLPVSLDQDTLGYKMDEWGALYGYSGITVNSTGSGSTISKKFADASSDYLLNQLNGTIRDADDSLPGSTYADSVRIQIAIPDGVGSTTSKWYNPSTWGNFMLDSLPVGTHPVDVIFIPTNDTLHRFVTILPRHKSWVSYAFASNYFAGGSSPNSSSEILRPDGVGTYTNLNLVGASQNWQAVAEATADDDASYVSGFGTQYEQDTYRVENHTSGAGTIDSVVIHMVCAGVSAGKKARTLVITNGSEFGGVEINLTTVSTYVEYYTTYTTNPATLAAWTWTEIDNLEIGIDIKKDGHCTQVWAEVFYTN